MDAIQAIQIMLFVINPLGLWFLVVMNLSSAHIKQTQSNLMLQCNETLSSCLFNL